MIRKFALIMAGGKGQRLWPLSTADRPKQLIPLFDGKTLLDMALERVGKEAESIILTNRSIADKINFGVRTLVEPVPKNTAPALIYATALLQEEIGAPVLVSALPADHYIRPVENFRRSLNRAYDLAQRYGKIVTFGIKPTHPHTGYGYIERGKEIEKGVWEVRRFHEKPDYEKAQEYLSSGSFYWNSGMFVWRSDFFLEEVKKHAKDVYDLLYRNGSLKDADEFFSKVEAQSIDYAIMEKTRNIVVLEANFDWMDVGSYSSLYSILQKDERGNAYRDDPPFTVDSSKNLVVSGGKKVVLVGVSGLGVVIEGDVVLVVSLEKDQKVKEVSEKFV